ncbi:MAG: hypothetical protein IT449_04385 [Phycisphaerales bacterium]|nr:hypothetical protein [Phycisphaerales bacterium]
MTDAAESQAPPAGTGAAAPARPPCPECGYDLTGLTSSRCPECGWVIDARLLEVLARARPLAAGTRFRAIVAFASLVLTVLILLVTRRMIMVTRFSWNSLFDVMAFAAAVSAALGLTVLALLALRAHRAQDSDRAGARTRFQAWATASLLMGIAAAGGAWALPQAFPTATSQTSLLEFGLRAALFALPGLTLLAMASLLFESRRGRVQRAEALLAVENEREAGAPFVVQAFGRYAASQVTQAWHDAPRRSPPQVEALIAQTWERKCAEAMEKGVLLYNGELARLLRCQASPTSLHLDLGPGCYRDFVGTNLHHAAEVASYGDDCLGNPCGVSSNVITADGFLLLGRRNDRVAYHPGCLHPFGGALEADDRAAQRFDLFSAARRELCEELRLTPDEIRGLTCIGLVRDREMLQPEFLFDAVLTLSLSDVLARFDPLAQHQEHARLESCFDLPEEVIPFLSRSQPIAPIGEGGLLLHGRHEWGMDWYETTCLVLYGEIPPEYRSGT